jgi:hypothetical protein
MAYRQIHVELWDDPWVIELPSDLKLLFIYLFSNSRTNAIGLYEISERVIAFETGLPVQAIADGLRHFMDAGKVYCRNSWIWVPKLLTRNTNNIRSPQVQAMIAKQIRETPDSCPFKADWIQYYNNTISPQYGIDTIFVAVDTFCSATATVSDSVPDSVSVSVPASVLGNEAIDAYVKIRGGSVNPLDVDQIDDLANECEKHRAALPRGTPGADKTGDEWVRAAIMEANASRKDGPVSLNYIKAIIDRWRVSGFQSRRGDTIKVAGL